MIDLQESAVGWATWLVRRASERFRKRLLRQIEEHRSHPERLDVADILSEAIDHERRLARAVRFSQLGSWLLGAVETARSTPALPPHTPNRLPSVLLFPGDDPPRLPKILQAANWLRTRLDYEPDEFRALDSEASRLGFTVARTTSLEAVNRIKNALAENVLQGQTLRTFRETSGDALAGTLLNPSQVETVYRTAVSKSYAAGQRTVLEHPLVAPAFPYCLYSATHDSRVRPEHLQLERMGLNGTAIYRTDDPFWELFTPPWAWNCRCLKVPLSIRDAARKGVLEAKEWLRTGRPPVFPEYVATPEFSPPEGWVPVGRGIPVAA